MKLAPKQIQAFLAAPDRGIEAVLLYGPDAGLVRERARRLVAAAAGAADDPFRVGELTGEQVVKDPARLFDEAAALSLTGGRRAVRLRGADDELAPVLEGLLAAPPGAALVVIEAGELAPRSALRKLCEASALVAALPCYRDEGRELAAVIDTTLSAAGLRASPEAHGYLISHLGGDRQLSRRELEKLVLYMGPGRKGREVSLADAQACIGDTTALTLEGLAYAVGDGDQAALERLLVRAFQEGASWVQPLRTTARHLQRLHAVAAARSAGEEVEAAMKRLQPPPFWKLRERFRRQAAAWPIACLAEALTQLTETELEGKRGLVAGEILTGRVLLVVTSRAPGRRRRKD